MNFNSSFANKVSKTVADISVSGAKLRVSYSDGTSKDMDMPPATSLRLPNSDGNGDGYTIITSTENSYSDGEYLFGAALLGTTYYNYAQVPFKLTGLY